MKIDGGTHEISPIWIKSEILRIALIFMVGIGDQGFLIFF
ncbi:hypothetical protein VL20_349 [Microcystis panniformis FACHB-1757]|uniref:Uncharacterized protein n=1 Tax=Microcystis panniformis FACHB-1757 TaxID=1638788 RepID=A0A0K1RUX7_9CHRO|nr:hypothetical protein VL20_349 [Microcystis panniformis FACHB-1757]